MRFMVNDFVLAGRKARIRVSFWQQRKELGGIVPPNVEIYYQAALLENLLPMVESTEQGFVGI